MCVNDNFQLFKFCCDYAIPRIIMLMDYLRTQLCDPVDNSYPTDKPSVRNKEKEVIFFFFPPVCDNFVNVKIMFSQAIRTLAQHKPSSCVLNNLYNSFFSKLNHS